MTTPTPNGPPGEQAEHWVVRLASGEIDAVELAEFKSWHAAMPEHREAFDRERALWQSLEGNEAAFATVLAARRRRIRRWTRLATPPRALAAAAAAAAMIFLAPNVAVRLKADEIAQTGEIRTVALPDGSTAMLDSDAAIAIKFGSVERRVELLRGQVWFDVQHGDRRPFRVAALGGVTEDVGTAFEVSRGDGAVTIGVTQGAVRVVSPEKGNALTLPALARARYFEGAAVKRLDPGLAISMAAWRRGIIVIDGRPVEEAIAEVARYRPGLTFVFANVAGQPRVNGVFRTDAPDEALQTLAHMAGLRVVFLPGGTAVLRR